MFSRLTITTILIFSVCGCSSLINTGLLAYTNVQNSPDTKAFSKASFLVKPDRGKKDMLMILAFSGGGSRAAYWSASTMLRLEQVFNGKPNLLKEVDAISSVSGGGLPAAYYAISTEPGVESEHDRVWDEKTVKNIMTQDYILRWIGNWFWPGNIAKYWFSAYDRTDIMAQTFADNLYDVHMSGSDLRKGRDLTIGEIGKDRPYLILNSTNATAEHDMFGQSFTFTQEDFNRCLDSDINEYSIARAVMASASFPAAFNSMTLLNYKNHDNEPHYIHVFDGGNVDNLGLKSVERIFNTMEQKGIDYKTVVVILVDAYTDAAGIHETLADPRSGLDFFVDSNFIDATDSLLAANRDKIISDFVTKFESLKDSSKSLFYHLKFADVEDEKLNNRLNRIATSFNIKDESVADIDKAVERLLTPQNPCLISIKQLLETNQHDGNSICHYSH